VLQVYVQVYVQGELLGGCDIVLEMKAAARHELTLLLLLLLFVFLVWCRCMCRASGWVAATSCRR
jgi:hypothetical protein